MAKKVAVTLIVLYLLGVIGVTSGALSMHWNADWPLQQQIGEAVKAGFGWPVAVTDLFVSD